MKLAYRFFPLLAAVLTFAAFASALQNDFVDWDDRVNFVLNPHYRGLGWEQIRWMWSSALMARYIPVTWMTLGFDYNLWGMDPFGYHLTNVLFHAANAALFYFLCAALLGLAIPENGARRHDAIPLGALTATLLFALHPLRVESVAWVTERRDEVCGFFYLLCILAYLRAHRDGSSRSTRRSYYWAAFACCALAILSKEIAVTLPLVLLVLDYYPLRRLGWFGPRHRAVWLEKLPFLALGLADSVLAVYLGRQENMVAALGVQGWWTRTAVAVYNLAFYLWKTVLPFHLAPFYPVTAHRLDPHVLPFQLSAMLVIWISAAAFLFRGGYPALLAAWLAYIAALLPVLGIVNTFKQLVADRYSYLACMSWAILAGACIATLWSASSRQRVRVAITALSVVVLLALATLSWMQIRIWRNAEALWTYTAGVEPSFLASDGLGLALAERGDFAGAIPHFREALAMDPDYELAHHNLGAALMSLGNWEEAAHEFQLALQLKPSLGASHTSWGLALLMQDKVDEAIQHFRQALSINPEDEAARRHLERALAMKSR